MKKFNTISCEELMTEPMQPLRFFVDGLITSGLYILAGYPKVGKSWLAIDICLSVATGRDVLSARTIKGTALYLCLEDNKVRMQERIYELTDEPADDLHFVLMADKIGAGIGEIDVPNGLLHCGTEEIYTDTLTAFAEAVGEQTDVIEQYWNARDIESLTIKVHAIKSTSRIIGAEDIGTLAERLEKAGHDNDITALENGMDELLTRCRSLGRQLKPLVKADDDSALPPISPEELSELYGIIREFYSVADYDSFTQMIENLGSYRIPDSEKERCRALREAADALDYDLIPEILDKE